MPFFTIGLLFQDVCVQNDGMEIKVNSLTNIIIDVAHWNTTVFMHNSSVRISNTVFEDRSLDDRAMAFFRNLHKSSLGECPDILLINHEVGFAFLFGYSNLRSTNIPLLVMSRPDNIETHTELKELVQVPQRSSEMKGTRRTLVSLQLVIRSLDSVYKGLYVICPLSVHLWSI